MCSLERYKNVFFSFFFFTCGLHCQNREKIFAVRRTVRDSNVRHILTLNSSFFSLCAASTTTYSNDLVIFSLWKWHFQDLTRHLLPLRPQSSTWFDHVFFLAAILSHNKCATTNVLFCWRLDNHYTLWHIKALLLFSLSTTINNQYLEFPFRIWKENFRSCLCVPQLCNIILSSMSMTMV